MTLDNILIEGDKLYKSLNCLNVDELPRQIKLYIYNIKIASYRYRDMKLENLHERIL